MCQIDVVKHTLFVPQNILDLVKNLPGLLNAIIQALSYLEHVIRFQHYACVETSKQFN